MIPVWGFFLSFFSSRRRHTRCGRDWSSDVCFPILVGTACANPDNAPESAYDEGEPAVIDHAALPLAQRVMVGAFTYGGVWQGMGPVLDLEAELGRRLRSEERRVGKEGRSRWSPCH